MLSLASMTTGAKDPARSSSYAAVSPAGPAPMMRARAGGEVMKETVRGRRESGRFGAATSTVGSGSGA